MPQTPETWEQSSPEPGLPWRIILVPLELAIVFAAVFWVYNLTPHPERTHTYSLEGTWLTFEHSDFSICAYQGRINVWDLVEGREIASLPNQLRGLECAAACRENRLLVLGLNDGNVAFLEMDQQKHIGTIQAHQGRVKSMSFSPDGKSLATAGGDGLVRLWDVQTRQQRHTLQGGAPPGQWCKEVRFSPDGRFLYAVTESGSIVTVTHLYWDAHTGKQLKGPTAPMECFVPGTGSILYQEQQAHPQVPEFTQGTGIVRMWDLTTGKDQGAKWKLSTAGSRVVQMELSPDGQKLAYVLFRESRFVDGGHSDVVIMDVATQQVLYRLPTCSNPRFLNSDELLTQTSLTLSYRVKVWNLSAMGQAPTDYMICGLITVGIVGLGNLVWWLIRRLRRPRPLPRARLVEEI